MQYVYVVGSNCKPLMPCSPAKARELLKSKSAAVLQRTPFTIKLLHHAGGYTLACQPAPIQKNSTKKN